MPHIPRRAQYPGRAKSAKPPAPTPKAPFASGPSAFLDQLPVESGPINEDKPDVKRNPVVRKRQQSKPLADRVKMKEQASLANWDRLPDDLARDMGLL